MDYVTVRDLIRALLIEAGKEKRAEQIYRELGNENNEYTCEFAHLPVGVDVDPRQSIRYVTGITDEYPCFLGLNLEPEE